jgi:hypothetical protein
MTQADFDAKYAAEAVAAVTEPAEEAKADPTATEGAKPADDQEARLASLDVLRHDYGAAFTRDALSTLPTDTLVRMAAERKGRQDKITQTIERLKAGQNAATLSQPKTPTKAKGDDSPNNGAAKQRSTPSEPLDDDLDSLSDLDPEVTTSVKAKLEAARKERDEANQKAAAVAETLTKARFSLAMARATEAHPELKDARVREALLSAMDSKDPDRVTLESDNDDDIDNLIESCAERVIPKTKEQPKNSTPKGAPDLNTRRTAPKQMTQNDRDSLAFEAIQKVGTNPVAVEAYIQRKLGQA